MGDLLSADTASAVERTLATMGETSKTAGKVSTSDGSVTNTQVTSPTSMNSLILQMSVSMLSIAEENQRLRHDVNVLKKHVSTLEDHLDSHEDDFLEMKEDLIAVNQDLIDLRHNSQKGKIERVFKALLEEKLPVDAMLDLLHKYKELPEALQKICIAEEARRASDRDIEAKRKLSGLRGTSKGGHQDIGTMGGTSADNTGGSSTIKKFKSTHGSITALLDRMSQEKPQSSKVQQTHYSRTAEKTTAPGIAPAYDHVHSPDPTSFPPAPIGLPHHPPTHGDGENVLPTLPTLDDPATDSTPPLDLPYGPLPLARSVMKDEHCQRYAWDDCAGICLYKHACRHQYCGEIHPTAVCNTPNPTDPRGRSGK